MDVSEHRLVLTQQGYDDIKRELDEILAVKRPALVKRLKEAIALGDLSENFDYHDSKRQQGMLEARIRELKTILNSATIMEATAHDGGGISIGSKVVVRDQDGFEDEYMIVGPPEADPSEGKISYESSMGSALMGRKTGDVFCVETPGGTLECVILSVQ